MPYPPLDPLPFLRALYARAVEVADPMRTLAQNLPPRPKGAIFAIGAGKASARMAEALEAAWGPLEGLVITRYGYTRPTKGIEIIEAAHPLPDQRGHQASLQMLEKLAALPHDTFVVALISGGASALLSAPISGLSLADKQAINSALLASGAPISQMNILRKHLSQVKGGQLAAAAYPAQMLSLMISDVPGDDPAFIGSGPTIGDPSTPEDALKVAQLWGIALPEAAKAALMAGSGVKRPDDIQLSRVQNRIIAAPRQSLEAAADLARAAGIRVQILGDALEGEARDVARVQAQLARALARGRRPKEPALLLLSGGELTVTKRGDGIGGPNAEFALALLLELQGAPRIYALACDTDGVDGTAEVAGATIAPDSLARAADIGLEANAMLANNDAHSFFAALGDQVIPGPTLTNVNDFRAILIC